MSKRTGFGTLSDGDLSTACGGAVYGMKWERLPRSRNVEDRRGMSPEETERIEPRYLPLPEPGPRHPGDLASKLGLDDIDRFARRLRKRQTDYPF